MGCSYMGKTAIPVISPWLLEHTIAGPDLHISIHSWKKKHFLYLLELLSSSLYYDPSQRESINWNMILFITRAEMINQLIVLIVCDIDYANYSKRHFSNMRQQITYNMEETGTIKWEEFPALIKFPTLIDLIGLITFADFKQ